MKQWMHPDIVLIATTDITRSMVAMDLLCETIRFGLLNQPHYARRIDKYCRLLCRYQYCQHSVLVRYCLQTIEKIMDNAQQYGHPLRAMDMAIAFSDAPSETVVEHANALMTSLSGTNIRGCG
tara:strand:- start:940 stop:1308 length:369 start_codon:yes stop_codon:yes gene_type:complete